MKKIIWRTIMRRGQHPLIFNESCLSVLPNLVAKEIGVNLYINYWKRYEGSTFSSEEEFEKGVQIFLKKAKTSPDYLLKIIYKSNNYYKKLIAWAKKLSSQDFSQFSLKDLQKQAKDFYRFYNLSCVYIYLPFIVEESLKIYISKVLAEKYKINRNLIESTISKLTCLPRLTDSLQEKSDLWKLARDIKRNKELKRIFLKFKPNQVINKIQKEKIFCKVKNHQKRYAWLKRYIYLERNYTTHEIIENLQHLLKSKVNPLISYYRDQKMQKQLVKKLKIKGKLLKIIKISQEWVYYRQNRVEKLAQLHYNLKPFLSELARRYGITYEQIIQLRLSELLSGHFKESDIKARIKGHAVMLDNGHFRVITGRKFKMFLKKEKEVCEKCDKLYGTVAQKGKAKGRVRIGNAYTFHNLKKGEILVTGMTTPEATPFLKRVVAIITDEGGITCHAAIVSRELGIPCIIGTKIATQVLKDGDWVEVDANRGIVKKL